MCCVFMSGGSRSTRHRPTEAGVSGLGSSDTPRLEMSVSLGKTPGIGNRNELSEGGRPKRNRGTRQETTRNKKRTHGEDLQTPQLEDGKSAGDVYSLSKSSLVELMLPSMVPPR